ncbi:Multidrug transporter OS=Lysinibacillus sphaericus OX=1421 GN=LS41612_17700 PE=4 SV=1 [Lysinibacillus sphaericus]
MLFTPTADPSEDDSGLEENSASVVDEKGKETSTTNSTVEFQDESTEDIAQAVRTMMHREDEQQVNA